MADRGTGVLGDFDQEVIARLGLSTRGLLDCVHRDLQTPDPPAGAFHIAGNIVRIRDKIAYLASVSDTTFGHVFRWAETLDALPDDHPLRSHSQQMARENADGSLLAPLRRLYTSHPVWCVIWHQHAHADRSHGTSLAETYEWLQAQFLVATSLIAREGDEKRVKTAIYQTSLLLRDLHLADYAGYLGVFTGVCNDPHKLANKLSALFRENKLKEEQWSNRESISERNLIEARRGALSAFCRILVFAHDLEGEVDLPRLPFRESKAKPAGKKKGRTVDPNRIPPDHSHYGFLKSFGTLQASWRGHGGTLHHHRVDKSISRSLGEQGQDPKEYESDPSLEIDTDDVLGDKVEDFDPNRVGRPELGMVFALAAVKGRHIAVDNQRQLVDRRRVRIHEIQLVVEVLNRLWKEYRLLRPVSDKARDERDRCIALLQMAGVGFVTGTPPDGSDRLQLVDDLGSMPNGVELACSRQEGVWVRPYRLPIRNPVLPGEVTDPPRVLLPDLWGVSDTFSGAPQERGDDGLGRAWPKYELRSHRRRWGEVVRPELEKAGLSPRWSDLASMIEMLPSWFAALEEGDHLTVAALFDRADAMAETHRYYTAYPRDALARVYRREMEELGRALGLPGRGDDPHALLAMRDRYSEVEDTRIGSDRAPSVSAVSDLLSRLREPVKSKADRDLASVAAEHNRITAYTAIGLALATGFRAVRTPITDLTKVHRPTSTILLREKDQWDGRHARLVVLPDVIMQQVDEYLRHLRRLYVQLPLSSPMECEVKATKNRDRSRYGSDSFELDLRKTLFFLDWHETEEWVPAELTGNHLKVECDRLVGGAWPVGNAGRHFLRTALTEVASKEFGSLPTTAINAVLGHWRYGEEPWTPQSAFDPARYREVILPALDVLLCRVGYVYEQARS